MEHGTAVAYTITMLTIKITDRHDNRHTFRDAANNDGMSPVTYKMALDLANRVRMWDYPSTPAAEIEERTSWVRK